MRVYDAVRTVAAKKHKSISFIERQANLSKGSISKWNKSSPTVGNLKKVADALGVPVTRLINECEKNTDDPV